jgi:pyrimidine-nucleoside phosphorylase
MLSLSGLERSLDLARQKVRDALASGSGLRKLQEVVELQGGDPRVCDDSKHLPRARETIELRAEADGRVARIACRAVGQACMLLGAGRETVDSIIDPAVGVVLRKKVGDLVIQGESLLTMHVNDKQHLGEASALLKEAIRIAAEAPARLPLIQAVFD